jgi:SAM-dependent methyltransferase
LTGIGTRLTITEQEIRRHGQGHLLLVCWQQWRTERALGRRGLHFRTVNSDAVAAAYAAMNDQEFDAINGRQDWANWRTIPRALSGHVPDRALRVLDLGCGTGSSTRVLAFYCPQGSRVTGYEIAAPLLEIARQRPYRHRGGQPARVDFSCQGVTEPLRADGAAIPDQSVDLVNASGIVGHHLTAETISPLVQELRRVVRHGGIAMLDVGPTLSDSQLTAVLTVQGFQRLGRFRSCLWDTTGQIVFERVT